MSLLQLYCYARSNTSIIYIPCLLLISPSKCINCNTQFLFFILHVNFMELWHLRLILDRKTKLFSHIWPFLFKKQKRYRKKNFKMVASTPQHGTLKNTSRGMPSGFGALISKRFCNKSQKLEEYLNSFRTKTTSFSASYWVTSIKHCLLDFGRIGGGKLN